MALKVASEDFWGVKLTASNPSHIWDCPEEDGVEFKLFVCQSCLGVDAKENERNIVEVTCTNDDGESSTHCITSLKVGLLEQAYLNIGFTSTATFRLASGSGPVHIIGSQLAGFYDGDESIDDEAEESSCSEGEEAEEEQVNGLELMPSTKRSKVGKAGVKKVLKKTETSSDEEDDDDDDDDDDEEGEEGEDDSEDETTETPAPKKGTMKNKENKEKSGKKVTFAPNPAKATQSLTNIESVKTALKKIQNLPKTVEKFQNFLKSNLKINDSKLINEAWVWVSKNKK